MAIDEQSIAADSASAEPFGTAGLGEAEPVGEGLARVDAEVPGPAGLGALEVLDQGPADSAERVHPAGDTTNQQPGAGSRPRLSLIRGAKADASDPSGNGHNDGYDDHGPIGIHGSPILDPEGRVGVEHIGKYRIVGDGCGGQAISSGFRRPGMVPVLHVKAGRFDVQEVRAHDVRRWWPFIREGLIAVKKKVPVSWIPEDIYGILLKGRAFVLAVTCGNDFAGFAILAPDGDEFSGVKEMLVWETYVRSGYPDLVDAVLPFIEDRAKGLGFHGLVMHSSREGWKRAAPKIGFVERNIIWVKPLR